MMEFMIINSYHGYVIEHNGLISFTHNIAEATVSIKFERMKDLCERCGAGSVIWAREKGGKWQQYCVPSIRFNPSDTEKLLRETFKGGQNANQDV